MCEGKKHRFPYKWTLKNDDMSNSDKDKEKDAVASAVDAIVRQPIYDKTGREIMVGDTLKVFYFIGKRKKKHYMYKFVDAEVTFGDRKVPYLQVKHLNQRDEHYHLLLNGKKHDDIEIVQGFGDDGTHFEDRPKVA